ncbi:MAG TPA: rhomboid family intramembrane serine protease [Marinobacter sp.]|jgi:membrane associated rhomboid family serine protease|nr:rhomboid family intramembrane serine protease [Marinobacter sp.]
MLIIPAEKKLDWKHPPVVTLGLMLACLLVFVFYQADDVRLQARAVERYLESDLQSLEAPVYETYLQRQIRLEGEVDRVHELQDFQDLQAQHEDLWIALTLLMDREFYQYLQEEQDLLWAPRERQLWAQQRGAIEEELLARVSVFRLGLIPAETTLYTLITYQFLHGGWGHLIGNLIFLFLLGFTVERALGPGRYLLSYLVCGALSGLIYSGLTFGSHMPLVGASGSISGLMGMYVAIYGLQRIRFFYFVGVYFNYFRAPALAILPVWIGKEIYDYWFAGASGVAYLAHAGGLVAGAGLVCLLGRSVLQVKDEFYAPEPEEQDRAFTEGYARAMASIGRMEFDLARRQFGELRQSWPDRFVVLEHLYHLDKLRPDLPAYRESARAMLNEALNRRLPERMLAVWKEYLRLGEPHQPLEAEDHNRVLFASLKQHDLKTAEKAFERLRHSNAPLLAQEASQLLADEFDKRQMPSKAQYYRQMPEAH